MGALPKQVQKKVDEANALAAKVAAVKTEPTAPADPAASTPASPAPNAAAPAPPATGEGATQPTVDWEHKFKVLQGKYNAEVPRLTRQVQEQEQRLRDISQQLLNTQTQLTSLGTGKTAPAGAPAQPPQRRVKDDEINAFGGDLYDFIKRAAREEMDADIAEVRHLKERLTRTEETTTTVGETVTRDAVQKVYKLLDDQVPDWRELNEAEPFLQWLQEEDPYTGLPRGRLLAQAYEAHDGPRVVAFFKGYKNENAAIQPPPAPPPANPAPAAPEVRLEGLVAPGTPKSGPQGGAPSDAGKRVWNQADAKALYRAINEYTKKGKAVPKELQALEADLIRAQGEQRLKV